MAKLTIDKVNILKPSNEKILNGKTNYEKMTCG
jgi:hypothetical protein